MTATLEAPADAHPTPGDESAEPPQPLRGVPVALAPWHDPHPWLGWAITAAVTVLAAFTRFWALGWPHGKTFDEVYYVTESKELLRYGYEDNRGYMFIVHPPLGKWLIALSSHFWHGPQHLDSYGWRIAPALAGVLGVVVLTRTVRRMLRSNLFGGIAGALFAMEGLSLVLSRTALLDIFLQFFVLAGFGALVVDRDRVRARLAALIADGADLTDGAPSLGPRPWRLLAGAMFGAACAVKWTALSFFVLFVLLSLIWDRAALRAAGVRRPTRAALRRSVGPAAGSLLATPIAVYLLSYLGWFYGENSWGRHWADSHSASTHLNLPFGLHPPFSWGWLPGPIRSLGAYTLDAYRFHEGLDSGHPYKSNPWSWFVLGRPVDFYYDGSSKSCGSSTCAREVLLIGTPLLWWAFVPMLLWLAWHWITTRDWRAGAVWVAFIAGWVVWFQDTKRTMFLFYMAPLVPFLIIGVTLGLGVMLGPALRRTGDRQRDRRATVRRQWGIAGVCTYLGLVVADFVWMWPIFTGGLLTYNQWHAHMWLPSWV
ncbi:MAG: dolichyl-phosphate-mannose-protein mannosyltransferase [Pseudonocardiales bacterium]|nr:dolichyl-phosphate-mannose-protein mannosyltransferase [Pseudonocardiales bacterium]MDT4946965.1 dolichyl-phosphate-mannose-protein mannosyltransferase [Pseudonocardiales bacterium]